MATKQTTIPEFFQQVGDYLAPKTQTPATKTPADQKASTNPVKNITGSSGSTNVASPALAQATPAKTPSVSSTTISNANKMAAVPEIKSKTDTLASKGVTTDTTTGAATYANGQAVPEPTEKKVDLSNSTGGYFGDVYYAPGATLPVGTDGKPVKLTATSATDDSIQKQLNDRIASTDAMTANLISNIQAQYNTLIDTQKRANASQQASVQNALLMGGVTGKGSSAQYAPISSAGIVSAQITYGLGQIADLEAKENAAIVAAQKAGQDEKYQIQDKINEEINKIRDEKIAAATKLSDDIAKQNKELADKQQKVVDQINSIALEAKKNGASDKIVAAITSSPDVSAALNAAGGSLQTASGQLGDYLQYKRDTENKGLIPYDYATWKEQDDARQARLKSSEAYGVAYSTAMGKKAGEKTAAGTQALTGDEFTDSMLKTAGGKALTDTTIQKLDKGLTVLGQLGVLQENVKDLKTGPLLGILRKKNPWDTQAQTIKAQLNAIVPNLARGVYGEVGVLTDNDVAQYSKTIPNLTSTEEVRNAVMYITLDMIGKSIKNTLSVNAAAGRDVSGFVDIYTEMENSKNSIISSIPGAVVPSSPKSEVDNYIKSNPGKSEEIAKMYEVPGTTDQDVWDYIKLQK